MRKIVLDFELTIVWPLILFALIALWNSIRAYRKFPPERKEKWNARRVIWLSCAALVVLFCLLFIPDEWKAVAAYQFWSVLWFINAVSVLIGIAVGWHYARKANWFHLGLCVLLVLMMLASLEHVFHQSINARHLMCPDCANDN